MALRSSKTSDNGQLDLFSYIGADNDRSNSIRSDGRKTLARVLPESGEGSRSQGDPPPDASGGGGENKGRDGLIDRVASQTWDDTSTSARSSLGNDSAKVYLSSPRTIVEIHTHGSRQNKNSNNYRITEADRLGEGGSK